jgi:hypothetical protein
MSDFADKLWKNFQKAGGKRERLYTGEGNALFG